MATQQPGHLHHLPNREQNIFYILVLIASPLINLFINSIVYAEFSLAASKGLHTFTLPHQALGISSFLLGSILVLFGINLAQTLMLRHHKARHSFLIFGIFSSAYLMINLLTVSYGILAVKVQSLLLLLISGCIYVSVNIIFVFWYWYVDYPTQIKHLHNPEIETEITFPEREVGDGQPKWLPDFVDYVYLTVITSNTLSPPENHSPGGQLAKAITMMHSLSMLVILVFFVSRAIDTLS